MSRELHVFWSGGCGWCSKMHEEVNFPKLGEGINATVLLHRVPSTNQFYSGGSVPELVLTENGKVLSRMKGYVPGGTEAFQAHILGV